MQLSQSVLVGSLVLIGLACGGRANSGIASDVTESSNGSSFDDPTSASKNADAAGGGAFVDAAAADGDHHDRCLRSCSELNARCVDTTVTIRCYGDCDEVDNAQIERFVSCVARGVCDPTCTTEMEPQDVGSCQKQCDEYVAEHCASAIEADACRRRCDEVPPETRGEFTSCVIGPQCYFKHACFDWFLK